MSGEPEYMSIERVLAGRVLTLTAEDIGKIMCDSRDAAIEECARVAESYYEEHLVERVWGKPIAAAIRALKDRP